jgi:NTP pyrophosphatase (non-canonical NTP hydrolase)
MDSFKYQMDAFKTENTDFEAISKRSSEPMIVRLDHAAMGLTTEIGEFVDVLKKYKIYGKPIDTVNLQEEIGDIFWYIALACNALGGVKMSGIMERNIAKLKARYPEKYTNENALERNLETERQILESKNL